MQSQEIQQVQKAQSQELSLQKSQEQHQTHLLQQAILTNGSIEIDTTKSLSIANALDSDEMTISQLGVDWFNDYSKWTKFLVTIALKAEIVGKKESEDLMDTGQAEQFQRFLWNNCGEYKLSEIYLAVEKNSFGDYPSRVQHFQQITASFIGQCLDYYQQEKRKYSNFISKSIISNEVIKKETEMKEQWETNRTQILETLIKEEVLKLTNGNKDFTLGDRMYEIFSANGYIQASPEKKEEAMTQASKNITQELNKITDRVEYNKIKLALESESTLHNKTIAEAKRILYIDFLKSKIDKSHENEIKD